MAEKIIAFKQLDDMGGQYVNTEGRIITVEKDAIVVDANVDSLYAEKVVNSKKIKKLKYGWAAIKNYLPPATPVDVKVREAEMYKQLSDENIKLKAELDKKEEEATGKDA